MPRDLTNRLIAAVFGAVLFNLLANVVSSQVAIGTLGAYVFILNERMAGR